MGKATGLKFLLKKTEK